MGERVYNILMKKFILHFRAIDKSNFLEMKKGLKVVETRAATPKYRGVKKAMYW
jgi:hypothetical protein